MTAEDVIAAIAIKCEGDWDKTFVLMQEYHNADEEEKCRMDEDLEVYLDIATKSGYKYTTIVSESYPDLLKKQYRPPFVLFYRGDISLLQHIGKNVAVVGSRECTDYGIEMTKKIVRVVAKEYVIVSGMAKGIDAIAHQTAIDVGGKTIAVLGGGVDYCYPPTNLKLYKEIKKNHLVISEYPGAIMPKPENFPRRNRIIAMLSRGTIVTEAYAKSGTLTTVMFTLQCNRLLMCVPYLANVNSECNRLIKQGAFMIQTGEEAVDLLKTEIHI